MQPVAHISSLGTLSLWNFSLGNWGEYGLESDLRHISKCPVMGFEFPDIFSVPFSLVAGES